MELIVTTESRFFRGPDGRPSCADGTHSYQFWSRYLDVFDHVTVVGREAHQRIEGGAPVEGPSVSLFPLPDSRGVAGALAQWSQWRRLLLSLLHRDAAYCVRVPGIVGTSLCSQLERMCIGFAAEIVGDPLEVFARGSFRHPLRPWIRAWFRRNLIRQCRSATATAYVTRHMLQEKYPPRSDRYTTHYSSIDLPSTAFRCGPREERLNAEPWHLISVGTMSQIYKGFQFLIQAVRLLADRGHEVRLTLVGDGKYRSQLNRQARNLGLEGRIRFAGRVSSGAAVRRELDQADVFVMPSLTEGLPRALIEAQARALPCLGSRVGGIPELLDPTELVSPGDANALALAIEDLMRDAARQRRLSGANLRRARAYSSDLMRRRRIGFYQYLAASPMHADQDHRRAA